MLSKEFWTFLITMVVGGLTYSILSFSYLHSKFPTVDVFHYQGQRIDRIEHRIDKRLSEIDSKLDRLIENSGRRHDR